MTDADLVFFQGAATSGDLVYGDNENAGSQPPRQVQIAITLPALTVSTTVGTVEEAEIVISLPSEMVLDATVEYDNSTIRYLHGATRSAYQPAKAAKPTLDAAWDFPVSRRGGTDIRHQPALRIGPGREMSIGIPIMRRPDAELAHNTAIRSGQISTSQFETGVNRRAFGGSRYQVADYRAYLSGAAHQTGANRRYVILGPWQPAKFSERGHQGRSGASLHRRGRSFATWWQMSRNPLQGRESLVEPPVEPPEVCYTPSGELVFSWPAGYNGTNIVFQCGDYTPPPVGQIVVPVRKVYIVSNNVTLRRVSDNALIPATSMSLALDVGSWTWSFNASLPGVAQQYVEPTVGGPVELKVSLNGTEFRVLAENLARERVFGKTTIRVSGRGKNALLDAPFAPVTSFGNTIDRTANQLMEDVLTLNGIPIGWGITFELEDWLVPAGVFNHQGSYITALGAIAKAAGGFLLPHASAQSFSVKHLYPSAPWAWGSVTPDFTLPASVTTRESLEWKEKPEYNRVFVSGQGSGVLGQVTRTGTAGDLVAPMVVDQLITQTAAARQRGRAILSDTGRQIRVGLKLPVLPETGVIQPGAFVQYVDGGTTHVGIVRGTNIDMKLPDVWQSLEVETHA